MYAGIHRYRTSELEEVLRRVRESFVPLIRESPGFVAYHVVAAEDGTLVTISVFEGHDGLMESSRLAAEWAREYAADLLLGAPEVVEGELEIQEFGRGWGRLAA